MTTNTTDCPFDLTRPFDLRSVETLLEPGALMVRHVSPRSGVSVTVTRRGVSDWASRWPCFGPIRPIWFAFQADGDLVDIKGDDPDDGGGASALATDAYFAALVRRKVLTLTQLRAFAATRS